MRMYYFEGRSDGCGLTNYNLLRDIAHYERIKVVERYCGRPMAEVNSHEWMEFFQDCFGNERLDNSVGQGKDPALLYYIHPTTYSVENVKRRTARAFFIRLFGRKLGRQWK